MEKNVIFVKNNNKLQDQGDGSVGKVFRIHIQPDSQSLSVVSYSKVGGAESPQESSRPASLAGTVTKQGTPPHTR